ncbi:MAG: hypothetical protein ABII27_00740 [bacterium]
MHKSKCVALLIPRKSKNVTASGTYISMYCVIEKEYIYEYCVQNEYHDKNKS